MTSPRGWKGFTTGAEQGFSLKRDPSFFIPGISGTCWKENR